jgi:hypothetical protein
MPAWHFTTRFDGPSETIVSTRTQVAGKEVHQKCKLREGSRAMGNEILRCAQDDKRKDEEDPERSERSLHRFFLEASP